jgi:SAM-dependent methyltransferase
MKRNNRSTAPLVQNPQAPLRQFTAPTNYIEYVERTNEKQLLRLELERAFLAGELPIRPGDRRIKRILDLGCGPGVNAVALSGIFSEHQIIALDVAKEQASWTAGATTNLGLKNIEVLHGAFEDFKSGGFDFILASHVLQYIDTPLTPFISKIRECLKPGGEAWILVQEKLGINQIVESALPYLSLPHPYLRRWFTHDRVRRILSALQISFNTKTFISHFTVPSDTENKQAWNRLINFFLIDSYEQGNPELETVIHNVICQLQRSGSIVHKVSISKFSR